MNAGKGDSPRNCFSSTFKDNFDKINWGIKAVSLPETEKKTTMLKKLYPCLKCRFAGKVVATCPDCEGDGDVTILVFRKQTTKQKKKVDPS